MYQTKTVECHNHELKCYPNQCRLFSCIFWTHQDKLYDFFDLFHTDPLLLPTLVTMLRNALKDESSITIRFTCQAVKVWVILLFEVVSSIVLRHLSTNPRTGLELSHYCFCLRIYGGASGLKESSKHIIHFIDTNKNNNYTLIGCTTVLQ